MWIFGPRPAHSRWAPEGSTNNPSVDIEHKVRASDVWECLPVLLTGPPLTTACISRVMAPSGMSPGYPVKWLAWMRCPTNHCC